MTAPERRLSVHGLEVRGKPGAGAVLAGHAAVFNKLSLDLGGFVEEIAPGTFTKTLADGADVRAYIDHDTRWILGRTKNGTLGLREDEVGLYAETTIDDRSYAVDLSKAIERGDITQMSFAFQVPVGGDEWGFTPQEYPKRTLTQVRLYDVSYVAEPAYPDANDANVERALRSLAKSLSRDFAEVKEAAEARELRSLMVAATEVIEPESKPLDVTGELRLLELSLLEAEGR